MFYQPILLPLLAQVALTFLVWICMYISRMREISGKRIEPQALAHRSAGQALLTDSAGPADNFKNLFELPMLFFIVILLSLMLLIQDAMLVQLAWAFVALRGLHSIIHCTYNKVLHRFTAYLASSLVLFLMWIRIGIYILSY
jgi:hypothetical protein